MAAELPLPSEAVMHIWHAIFVICNHHRILYDTAAFKGFPAIFDGAALLDRHYGAAFRSRNRDCDPTFLCKPHHEGVQTEQAQA